MWTVDGKAGTTSWKAILDTMLRIRLSLQWEPLKHKEGNEIIIFVHYGDHHRPIVDISWGLRPTAKMPATEIRKTTKIIHILLVKRTECKYV